VERAIFALTYKVPAILLQDGSKVTDRVVVTGYNRTARKNIALDRKPVSPNLKAALTAVVGYVRE
jgi:hypothetical protein